MGWGTTLPYLGPVTGVPPRKDMGPVEVLWNGFGVPPSPKDMGPEVLWDGDEGPPPPPQGCEQTENITSRLVLRTRSVIKCSDRGSKYIANVRFGKSHACSSLDEGTCYGTMTQLCLFASLP